MTLYQRRILLGVTGGIAAYKAVELARRLVQAGAQVQCVLTDAATEFVSPLALQAVTGRAVRQSLWDKSAEAAMGHIELAKWAEVLLIAPATADALARLAQGMANDLLTTLVLATQAKVMVSPAMNGYMWRHPATQANMATLQARGVEVIPPASGELACGDIDVGRLPDLDTLLSAVEHALLPAEPVLQGKHVLITAGPTYEDIDPVRFIGNRSSGKMGYALAEAARDLGASVTLVSGPSTLADPAGMGVVRVRSAQQMLAAVQEAMNQQQYDWMIAAAAVADYRVEAVASQKLKKQDADGLSLKLIQNPDIVAWVAASTRRPTKVIAFAAETENLLENANLKLRKKGVDAVLANSVADGFGFDQDHNCLTLISQQAPLSLGCEGKYPLALRALLAIAQLR